MSRLIRLYPPRWRARYEAEFSAVLDECRLSVADRLDILRGALRAWLNPRYGRSARRSFTWLTVGASLALLLSSAIGSLRTSPVDASPRYPVILTRGGDVDIDSLQFVVSGLQRPVPHLILAVDTRRSWMLAGVVTERSPNGRAFTVIQAPEVESTTQLHAWDFGRVLPGQAVRLTLDAHLVRPSAFAYSIHGYGALTSQGRPDLQVPLTAVQSGTSDAIGFGTAEPLDLANPPTLSTPCGRSPASGYRVCSVEDAWQTFIRFEFLNDGRTVPHLVLRVASHGTFSVVGVTASKWNKGMPRLLKPRIRSSSGSIYTLDFGRLGHGTRLHVHLVTEPTGHRRPMGDASAFADLNASGQPASRVLLFREFPCYAYP